MPHLIGVMLGVNACEKGGLSDLSTLECLLSFGFISRSVSRKRGKDPCEKHGSAPERFHDNECR